jgi:hypothetical protein
LTLAWSPWIPFLPLPFSAVWLSSGIWGR